MKKYFTTIETEEGKFKGTVYDSNTNQILYTTKLHSNQGAVTSEINEFISNPKLHAPPLNMTAPSSPPQIHQQKSQPAFKKRTCCGA